jgi:hypothetical protein
MNPEHIIAVKAIVTYDHSLEVWKITGAFMTKSARRAEPAATAKTMER